MAKITFIGAGSTVFMKSILADILLEPELNSFDIALHDIDLKRLKTSKIVQIPLDLLLYLLCIYYVFLLLYC